MRIPLTNTEYPNIHRGHFKKFVNETSGSMTTCLGVEGPRWWRTWIPAGVQSKSDQDHSMLLLQYLGVIHPILETSPTPEIRTPPRVPIYYASQFTSDHRRSVLLRCSKPSLSLYVTIHRSSSTAPNTPQKNLMGQTKNYFKATLKSTGSETTLESANYRYDVRRVIDEPYTPQTSAMRFFYTQDRAL